MFRKLLATLATLSLGLGLALTAAASATADPPAPTPPVGTFGTLVPFSAAANNPGYWTNYGSHAGTCFSFEGSNQYGTLTDGGKTVTLNAFQTSWGLGDHYELLVVKSGSLDNNVIVHPAAGVNYASTVNNGGQQGGVSHWILCFGSNPVTQPENVAVSGQATNQECVPATGLLTPGSILLTFTGPSAGVTITIHKQGDAAAPTAVTTNPITGLAPGSYDFVVTPASSAYTTTTPTFTVEILADTNPACADQPENVAVSGTATDQTCVPSTKVLTPGSILLTFTGPSAGVTITIHKQGDAAAPTAVTTNPITGLAPGSYDFVVTPASSAYTTTTPTFTVEILADTNPACDEDEEVKVVGDPAVVQRCELDDQFEPTGTWISQLTIETSASEPTGSVQYRVFFYDEGTATWVDKGLWPEGTYNAGDDPGNPFEIPFGTTIKVVAEATSGYVITTPKEWEYTFSFPDLCVPTLGTVTPVVTFAQTCSTGATYTLSIEGGVAGSVQWRVNGGAPTTQLGTFPFPASSSLSVSIVATPTPPGGFNGDDDGVMTFSQDYPSEATCDLTTLALTGQDPTYLLTLAALLGLLGTAMVRSMRRQGRREEA